MRVVIADDSIIVREGIAALLRQGGIDVAALATTAEALHREVDEHEPDIAIIDVRMPPTHTDEGLRAAHEIRDEFTRVLRHVAAGGAALDPRVVSRLLAATKVAPVQALSPREREVLELLAEGRSNKAIGEQLDLSERGVQKHVTSIFAKLDLPADEGDNRRILAVLEYLRPS
jgi:DNA-binding NarL/FixJ family response regulator